MSIDVTCPQCDKEFDVSDEIAISKFRLSTDLMLAAENLSDAEARFLVDAYYMMQDARIRAAHRERTLNESGEPALLITWLLDRNFDLEKQVKVALGNYAKHHQIGRWLLSIKGIGPVIASGLMAHIDIHRAKYAGHIWSFAGLNPGKEWKKGQKRPWNAALKTLCAYKLGESFVKVSNHEDSLYGQFYRTRKREYEKANENGEYEEQAREILAAKKFSKSTEAYKALSKGRLPQAQVHARARRVAVKLFISHFFERWYELVFNEIPPRPYAIAILDHGDYIEPPAMVE